jgi:hypothetical protein
VSEPRELTPDEVDFEEAVWMECPDPETGADVLNLIRNLRTAQAERDAYLERVRRALVDQGRAEADVAHLRGVLDSPELLETLASVEHDRWAGWMEYQERRKGDIHPVTGERFTERWTRQAQTPYSLFPENERESDRVEVRKTLDVIKAALDQGKEAKG